VQLQRRKQLVKAARHGVIAFADNQMRSAFCLAVLRLASSSASSLLSYGALN
jgi:hypothetical protein